jgi:hypothetical protein
MGGRSMSEGFGFNGKDGHRTLELFWRVVMRYHIDDEKCRINLLRRLVSRNDVQYIPHPEQLLKDKKALFIKKEEGLS